MPGLRLTTYVASGFFRSPFSTFMLMAVLGGAIWATVLFSISYWFGSFTTEWMSPIRWGVAVVFILALFFIARHNLLAYRAKKNETGIAADIRTP